MVLLGTVGCDITQNEENKSMYTAYVPMLLKGKECYAVLRDSDTFDKNCGGYLICNDKEGKSPVFSVDVNFEKKNYHTQMCNMVYQNLTEVIKRSKLKGENIYSRDLEQPLRFNELDGTWKPVELVKTNGKTFFVNAVDLEQNIPGIKEARQFNAVKVIKGFEELKSRNLYYDTIETAVYSLDNFSFEDKERLIGVYNNTSVGRLTDFKLNDKSGKTIDRLRAGLEDYPNEVLFMKNEDNFKDKLYFIYKERNKKNDNETLLSFESFIDKVYNVPSKKNRELISSLTVPTDNYNYEKYIGIHYHNELSYTSNGTVYTYAVSDALHDFDCNYRGKDKEIVGKVINSSIVAFKHQGMFVALQTLETAHKRQNKLSSEGQRFLNYIGKEYISMKRLKYKVLENKLTNGKINDKDEEVEKERIAKKAEKEYWKRFHEVNPDYPTPYNPVIKPKIKPAKKENPNTRHFEITM